MLDFLPSQIISGSWADGQYQDQPGEQELEPRLGIKYKQIQLLLEIILC